MPFVCCHFASFILPRKSRILWAYKAITFFSEGEGNGNS